MVVVGTIRPGMKKHPYPLGDGLTIRLVRTGSKRSLRQTYRALLVDSDGNLIIHESLIVICKGIDIPVWTCIRLGEQFRLDRRFVYTIDVLYQEEEFVPSKRTPGRITL